MYDEPHSPSGSYLNKFTLRFNAIKAFGGLAGNAAVAIDVPLHMYNMPQTPFDMQNKIVHNDFNKYSQHTQTYRCLEVTTTSTMDTDDDVATEDEQFIEFFFKHFNTIASIKYFSKFALSGKL